MNKLANLSFIFFALLGFIASQYTNAPTKGLTPAGGTILLSNQLPPFHSGSSSYHLIISGFGKTAYINSMNGHSYSILDPIDKTCRGGVDPPIYSRIYQSINNDLYYYCYSDSKIYPLKGKTNFQTHEKPIRLQRDLTFETVKWADAFAFITMLGIKTVGKYRYQSVLVVLDIKKDVVADMYEIKGSDGSPITEITFLNATHFYAAGARYDDEGNIEYSLYLGQLGEFKLTNRIGGAKGHANFIFKFIISNNMNYLYYSSLESSEKAVLKAYNVRKKSHIAISEATIISNSYESEGKRYRWKELFFVPHPQKDYVYVYLDGSLFGYKLDIEGLPIKFAHVDLGIHTKSPQNFRALVLSRKAAFEAWMLFDMVWVSAKLGDNIMVENTAPAKEEVIGIHNYGDKTILIAESGIFVHTDQGTRFKFIDILGYARDEINEEFFTFLVKGCQMAVLNIETMEMKATNMVPPQHCHDNLEMVAEVQNGIYTVAILDDNTERALLLCDGELVINQDLRNISRINETIATAGQTLMYPSCDPENAGIIIYGTTCDGKYCSNVYKVALSDRAPPFVSELNKGPSRLTRQDHKSFIVNQYDFFFGDYFFTYDVKNRSLSHFNNPTMNSFALKSLGFFPQSDGTYKVYIYLNYEKDTVSCVRSGQNISEQNINTPTGAIKLPTDFSRGSIKMNTLVFQQHTAYSTSVYLYALKETPNKK